MSLLTVTVLAALTVVGEEGFSPEIKSTCSGDTNEVVQASLTLRDGARLGAVYCLPPIAKNSKIATSLILSPYKVASRGARVRHD